MNVLIRHIVFCFLVGFFASDFDANARSKQRSYDKRIVIIVHRDNSFENLSLARLRMIFKHQIRRWPDGQPIIVLNAPARSNIRKKFDRKVLAMNADQSATFWINEQIRGRGRPPRSINNKRIAVGIVARFKSAISYISLADYRQLRAFFNHRIKALRIDNKDFNDEYYLSKH